MPFVQPYNMRHPGFTITSAAPNPVLAETELSCYGRAFTTKPTQEINKYTTFCGKFSTAGTPEWEITFKVYQSFGTDGLWTVLYPLCGYVVDFTHQPDETAVISVDNPLMTGQCRVPYFSFLEGEEGQPSEFDLVFPVEGTPTFSTTPPTALAADQAETVDA